MKYLLFIFLLPLTAFGRLGETFMECEARYGPCLRLPSGEVKQTTILDKNAAQAEWEYDGFFIKIAWLPPEGAEGPSDIFVIQNSKGGMTDQQIQAVLKANSNGMTWTKGTKKEVKEMLQKQGEAGLLMALGSAITSATIAKDILPAYYREDGAEAVPVTIKSSRLLQEDINKRVQEAVEREKTPKL